MLHEIRKYHSEEEKQAVWNKGGIYPGFAPDIWRYDIYGAWMCYDDYGNQDSEYGWDIHHHPEEAENESLPLHWQNHLLTHDNSLGSDFVRHGRF